MYLLVRRTLFLIMMMMATHMCVYSLRASSPGRSGGGANRESFFAPTGLLASHPSDCSIFLNQSEVKATEIVKKTIDMVKSHQLLL